MVSFIRTCLESVPNTRVNNIALFTVPVVNFIFRKVKEDRWFEKINGNASPSDLTELNKERSKFRQDFLIGTGAQLLMGVSSLMLLSSAHLFRSRLALLSFSVFGINAACSIPFHFAVGNVHAVQQ